MHHLSSRSKSFLTYMVHWKSIERSHGYTKIPRLLHTSNDMMTFSHLPFSITNSCHWCGSCNVLSCLLGRRAHHSNAHPTLGYTSIMGYVMCIFILLHNNNINSDYLAYQFTLLHANVIRKDIKM